MTNAERELIERIISCQNIVAEKEKELSKAKTELRLLFAEWDESHLTDKDIYL